MPTSTELKTAFDVPKVPNDSAKEDEGQSKTTFSGIMGLSKAAQKLKTTKGRIPKSCRTSTMDAAKALGILGFTSTRWLDMSSGLTPKQELDKAHFDKMMAITKKKDKEDKENNNKKNVNNFRRKQLTPDDQIRLLHEAYQFLLKKHKLGEDPKAAASLVSPFMKLEMEPKIIKLKDEPIQSNIISKDDQEEEEVKDEKILELEKAIEETSKTERKGSLKRKKSSKSSTKTAPKKKSLKA